jgi:hypothetical protein
MRPIDDNIIVNMLLREYRNELHIMTRLEHAQGIMNYYKNRIKAQDGSEAWRQEGLKVASWYLE